MFMGFYGDNPVESCDRNQLRNYLRFLFEEQQLKESSIKRRIASLKVMFRWMEFEEMIENNPFQRMSLSIKLPARLPRGLSTDELIKLLKAPLKQLGCSSLSACSRRTILQQTETRSGFDQLTTLVALNILFATGIRVSELTYITLDDIDLTEGIIKIHGKGDRERLVILPNQQTIDLVGNYMIARKKLQPKCRNLLLTISGKSADSQYIRILVRKAGESVPLERRITPHMLRHTTATKLLESEVDIRFVQRLLGHQCITTTQIYTHVSDHQLRQKIREQHPIHFF